MSDPGIPDGFSAREATDLRLGVWRFYLVEDPDRTSSVQQDNWVTRDGVAMPGQDGLREYLSDIAPIATPERIPAALLAAQAGHFLIRGSSRQSPAFAVEGEPSTAVEDGRFVLRATYRRGGGHRQPVQVSFDRDGNMGVEWGELAA